MQIALILQVLCGVASSTAHRNRNQKRYQTVALVVGCVYRVNPVLTRGVRILLAASALVKVSFQISHRSLNNSEQIILTKYTHESSFAFIQLTK